MKNTTLSILLTLAAAPLTAQVVEAPPPAVVKPDPAVKQDPTVEEVVPPAPPQDPVETARHDLEQMQRELEFLRRLDKDGGLASRVNYFVRNRTPEMRTVDLGVDAVVVDAPPTQASGARLMSEDEIAAAGAEVVFVVDGLPVSKGDYDGLLAYLQGCSSKETDVRELEKVAVRTLVMQKAAEARFAPNSDAARERLAGAKSRLDNGEDFAEVARSTSQCPSSAQGGDLGEFGRGRMDLQFERVAFSTKVGEVAPVTSAFGYHLIKVTGYEKGETPAEDKVSASHILASFDDNAAIVRQVMNEARSGQVDVAFVDESWLVRSPF